MLLTLSSANKMTKTISDYLKQKKKKKKEKYSTRKTVDSTVDLTADIVAAVLILLLLLMEVFLIVFLLIRTLREFPPSEERTLRIIMIILLPELYALFYIFLHKKSRRGTTKHSFSMNTSASSNVSS